MHLDSNYKNDFLLFPIEDWNGNRIFYKIPLKINSIKDTIYPFFICWIQVINATSGLNNNLSITNIGFS